MPRTVTVEDTRVLDVGDIGGAYTSRGYNALRGMFENLPDLGLTAYGGGPAPRLTLKGVEVRVWHASGAPATGVRIWLGVSLDSLHPGQLVTLMARPYGACHMYSWHGSIPMGAGVVWRIPTGGVIATDKVGWAVQYE
jgi:hypothetical protein